MAERLKLTVALASACLSIWLALPAGVGASHHGQGVADEVALRMSILQAPVAGAHAQIIASAALDDGDPAAGVSIEFLRRVDFLGSRLITLGIATTDATGTARISLDTNDPKIHIVARVAASDLYLPTEADADFDQPAIGDGPAPDSGAAVSQPSLAVVAGVMPPVLAFIALAIWLLLLGLALVTVHTIRAERQSVPAKKGRT